MSKEKETNNSNLNPILRAYNQSSAYSPLQQLIESGCNTVFSDEKTKDSEDKEEYSDSEILDIQEIGLQFEFDDFEGTLFSHHNNLIS